MTEAVEPEVQEEPVEQTGSGETVEAADAVEGDETDAYSLQTQKKARPPFAGSRAYFFMSINVRQRETSCTASGAADTPWKILG